MRKFLNVDEDPDTGQRTSTLYPIPFADTRLIMTHDGLFHADEVFAIALIHVFVREIPFIRTRSSLGISLSDPTILVLDQGGQHDEAMGNFDHHHLRAEAPLATVGLIFEYLIKMLAISDDEARALRAAVEAISTYDIHGPYQFNGFQVNELIKHINQINEDENEAFAVALSIAKQVVVSRKLFANIEIPKAKQLWKDGYSPSKGVKVCQAFPIIWKDMNEERWLVCRDKAGLWTLHAADREPGITLTGKEVFSAGTPPFVAGYKEKADAIDAAIVSNSK
jgi:hypothetical protein